MADTIKPGEDKTLMPVFSVCVSVARQTGPHFQNVSLDAVLAYSAQLPAGRGIDLLAAVEGLLKEKFPGSFSQRSQSAQRTLDWLIGQANKENQ